MAKVQKPSPLFILAAMLTAVAALYFASEILLPIALATLLSFLLTPLANRLESWRFPRVLAVIVVAGMSFSILGGVGWVVTAQLFDLSRQLPVYKQNLIAKIQSLRPDSPTFKRVSETLSDLREELVNGDKKERDEKKKADLEQAAANRQTQEQQPDKTNATEPSSFEANAARLAASGKISDTEADNEAVPVRVIELPPSPLSSLKGWLGPLVAPFTTAGIVIILVLFMLLDREGQRIRLVQLFGRSRMHIATEAMHDVTTRVGRYLRLLFLVNASYGLTVTVGLSLIGVPGAIMWGVLGFSLRFLPYLGPWIAAIIPLMVSIATSEGWSQPLIVAGWYIVVELISNNIVEPLVYGNTIGISTVGVIISAIFWTWLWGPIGLVLAMPMTVCLLVAARYVPQLRFLTILLGDQSPLSPSEHVYQRLLAFDYQEPLKLAQKHLKESSIASYYDEVLLPALRLAEHDRHDDLLNEDQSAFVIEAADDLVEELGDEAFAAISAKADSSAKPPPAIGHAESDDNAVTTRVLCIPLRDQADETVSHMLAQLLVAEGFDVVTEGAKSLASQVVDRVADSESDVVVISALPPIRPREGRLLWKRLRNRYPDLPIVVGFWTSQQNKDSLPSPDDDSASKVATTLAEAVSLVSTMAMQFRLKTNETPHAQAAG